MPTQAELERIYSDIGIEINKSNIIEEVAQKKATLGAWISGELKVKIDADPSRYYISFPLGGYSTALHYGRVGPVAGNEVDVIPVGLNDYEILHLSADRIQGQTIVNQDSSVAEHHHERGDTYEDAIDPRLITALKVLPGSSLLFTVAQGAYLTSTGLRWWEDDTTTFDLTSHVPSDPDKKRIVVILIDPGDPTIVMLDCPDQDSADPIDMSVINSLAIDEGLTAICFVVLSTDQATTEDSDYTSLFQLASPTPAFDFNAIEERLIQILDEGLQWSDAGAPGATGYGVNPVAFRLMSPPYGG